MTMITNSLKPERMVEFRKNVKFLRIAHAVKTTLKTSVVPQRDFCPNGIN
jgi:hypothetical protein